MSPFCLYFSDGSSDGTVMYFAFLVFLWKLLNSCCMSFDKDVQMLGIVQIEDVVSLVASTRLCCWLDFYGCGIDSAFQMNGCWMINNGS